MNTIFQPLRAWWRSSRNRPIDLTDGNRRSPLLIVLEGAHDIEFLRRISALLSRHDPELPDLDRAEARGEVIFIPAGGGNLGAWTLRLKQLNLREFHLYDREMAPATELRQQLVRAINRRPSSRAVLTGKRGLENYLHVDAIWEASGIQVEFGDEDSVADRIAQAIHRLRQADLPWDQLPARARKHLRERVKRWLNTRAVACMTVERLHESDAEGDVRNWLTSIADLLNRRH